MKALHLLKDAELSDGWISGGLIRNTVWNWLHGYDLNKNIADIDIVYCHSTIEDAINDTTLDGYLVEFRNQAFMSEWYNKTYGVKIPKFESVEQAFPLWSDTCNVILVRLVGGNLFEIKAPNGVNDLLSGIIRPRRERMELYGLPELDYYKRLKKWDIFNEYPYIHVCNSNNEIINESYVDNIINII